MTSTEIKTRLRDIKLEATRLRRELRKLEPKPKRDKVRKVKSAQERERERKYEAFKREHCSGPCWRCRTFQPLQRCHITKDGLSKRLEDVRLVNAMCPSCHDLHTKGAISTQEMIDLKRIYDPDNYDPEFLQRHSVRKLSLPTPPRGQRA